MLRLLNTRRINKYLSGNHKESQEPVGEQHLHHLIIAGQVPLEVIALVRVGPDPLTSTECQHVGGEGAGARALCSGITWACAQIS